MTDTTIVRVTRITKEVGEGMNMKTVFFGLVASTVFLLLFQVMLLLTN